MSRVPRGGGGQFGDCQEGLQKLNFVFKTMALTLEEVRRIAALARLRLSPDEELRFVSQLGKIVDYIDHLAEYPSASPATAETLDAEAADSTEACLPRAFVLANAPETFDEFLVVPQVKGDDG